MSKINFKACEADIEYTLDNLGKREELFSLRDMVRNAE